MPTLWHKFPDEGMFYNAFSDAEKKKLEDIFSWENGAPWAQALALMGIKGTPEPLVMWHLDLPYFNWSAMLKLVTGGAVTMFNANGQPKPVVDYSLPKLFSLFSTQWKISRFTERSLGIEDKLAHSIALGIVLQSLVIRLGSNAAKMPEWLSGAKPAPPEFKKTIEQMQAIQMLRTALSPVWKEIFPDREDIVQYPASLPEFFWDAPPVAQKAVAHVVSEVHEWKGISVCIGTVTGIAVTEKCDFEKLRQQYNAPLIFVFRRARPETTELFSHAAALLYAEGGVLSHACTVAREMNIPCVTGLGGEFYEDVKTSLTQDKPLWVEVDAAAAIVKRIK